LPGIGFVGDLLTRLEGQGLGKLNGNASDEIVYVLDPANPAGSGKVCHIERIAIGKSGDTETGRHFLARIRTTFVRPAGKSRPPTGNVDQLTLRKYSVEILGEPDGPLIM
jgi:hypothetical protein